MDDGTVGTLIGFLLVIVASVGLVVLSVRIVPQHARLVIFRLGRTAPALVRGPGLRFVIPLVDRTVTVDMRERSVTIPSQTATTSDGRSVDVDILVSYRINDALASVLSVADMPSAMRGIAMPTLRDCLAEVPLDEVRFERHELEELLRARLDEQAQAWGASVTRTAIGDVSVRGDRRSR